MSSGTISLCTTTEVTDFCWQVRQRHLHWSALVAGQTQQIQSPLLRAILRILHQLHRPSFALYSGLVNLSSIDSLQWQGHYPSLTAQYFTSLDPSLFSANSRTLNDIYTGIDVWGRGSYGGGGFGSYRALTRIDPEFLGLSAALFGQGWTWESEEGKPGWTWEKWWEYDRKLWFGPANPDEKVEVPDMPDGGDDAPYDPGPFRPLTTFFERRAPPNPVDLPLHVSFGMGVGHAWFINGMKVFQTDQGWTDVDKQTSLGDMLWPRPTVTHEGEITGDPLPCASSAIDMEDAWNGGSSLRITFCGRKVEDGDVCFQCLWVPIQSLAISPRQSYDATLIYKLPPNDLAAVDIGFSVRPSLSSSGDVSTSVVDETGLPGGWTKLSMQFQLLTDHIYDVASTLGLIVGIATEDRADFSILLGQINVFPSVPSPNTTSPAQARIMWVDLQPLPPSTVTTGPLAYLPGDLVWDVGATFPPIALGRLGDPEDPIPVWRLDTSERCFPAMLYFNVYFEWRGRADCERGVPMHPDRAVFIGTSGLDGQANRFYVDPKALPEFGRDAITFRFYVQGVTDRGEVLPWEQCAFVEVGEDDRRRDYNNETLVLQNM
jgi:mannosyl-glycoprotein endo-beta-N-acetylglucosaminidase